jgi:hypothetical protein
MKFQIFFPGVIPRTPMIKGWGGKGGKGKGKEGKEGRGGEEREGWDGVNPLRKTNPGYGPVYRQIVTASMLQENADSDVWHT